MAFHHAALPVDIQAEIEEAVRRGNINILIATSTLIEGVNLPFKTVIVGRRGYTDADGRSVEFINAPGLLNAVGRAGRAGRETEGWMILAELSAPYSPTMFEPLQLTGDDLDILSTLTTEAAFAGLADYEEKSRSIEDAIFHHYDPATDGFLSFIWFVAQTLGDLYHTESSIEEILAVIQRTLAWSQLDSDQRDRLNQAAATALASFASHPMPQRARWARSGTSLPTARTLDTVAEGILRRFQTTHDLDLADLQAVLDFIFDQDTLITILNLRENDRRGFKPYRTAPRNAVVPVDLKALLLDWVSGVELSTLADRYLSEIPNEGFRSETLAEFSASVFEHHLPWTIGVVLQWVNERLEVGGSDRRLPVELPLAIHYGASSRTALDLMSGGVRSRRLANAVATVVNRDMIDDRQSLRNWLADKTITEWRDLFAASPTEIADLLAFSRSPGAQMVSSILGGAVQQLALSVTDDSVITSVTTGEIRLQPSVPDPAPIQVVTSDGVAGTIRLSDHDDLSLLINMGISLDVRVEPGTTGPVVSISLAAVPNT